MSGNTQPGELVLPMPMAQLAQFMTQNHEDQRADYSFNSVDESNSFGEAVESSLKTDAPTCIPKVSQPPFREYKSEKKSVHYEKNKENSSSQTMSNNWTYHSKENHTDTKQSTIRHVADSHESSEVRRRPVPLQDGVNMKPMDPPSKRTPELAKHPSSSQKTKIATPKIKYGIRKFTPGSGRKSSSKILHQVSPQSNKKSVKSCLFPDTKPAEARCRLIPRQVPQTVPETPVNRNPMAASYAATPSFPQGASKTQSKILCKTTTIKGKQYIYIKKLGIGGSSEVYKVLEAGTSSEFAVKSVNLGTDPELARGYVNEVRLLRQLQNSDRVVRLYDYEYNRENKFLRLVLEVGETDLSSFLKARGTGLTPALVLHYWEEMLHAVNHIHDHDVIHADLKPANFLLVCGRLKLIDFGIASAVASDATSVVRVQATGTYSYISPEALMGGAGGYGAAGGDGHAPIKISFRSDVWSLGCILYSMVYGRTPFGHLNNLAKLAAIVDPNHVIHYPPLEHLPSSLIDALKWCLTYNAHERPFVRELLAIPYLETRRQPLPAALLGKLQGLVTPDEYKLLQSR